MAPGRRSRLPSSLAPFCDLFDTWNNEVRCARPSSFSSGGFSSFSVTDLPGLPLSPSITTRAPPSVLSRIFSSPLPFSGIDLKACSEIFSLPEGGVAFFLSQFPFFSRKFDLRELRKAASLHRRPDRTALHLRRIFPFLTELSGLP